MESLKSSDPAEILSVESVCKIFRHFDTFQSRAIVKIDHTGCASMERFGASLYVLNDQSTLKSRIAPGLETKEDPASSI
jgi:hypothetical protein